MITCIYADSLLDRLKTFSGRIGQACDGCTDKKCQHNVEKLGDEQKGNGYGMNIYTKGGNNEKR